MWGEFDSGGRSGASESTTYTGMAGPFDWPLERTLWAVLVVTFVADVATTFYGLHSGLVEGNPFVTYAIAWGGFGGFVATKLGTLAVAVAVRSVLPAEQRPVVPFAFALVWGVAVAVNLWVLF